jgi:DNA-3-methyladenine glycosylase I
MYRCGWAGTDDLYVKYHDEEWGKPVHDDRTLFEFLILEGAQAGLSWITILRKRENYRKAYENFDVRQVAAFGDGKVAELLENPGIVRNRLKIAASIKNAKQFLQIQKEFGSFDRYLWSYVDFTPVIGDYLEFTQAPCRTELSDSISKDLQKRGFSFVGSTIIYSYLQAVGVVDDHENTCFCKTRDK